MDETNALWIPSPHYFPHREGHQPRWIIIHGTAGFPSAEAVGYYFQHAGVATHYIIGRDGTIVQSIAECHGAWGNGGISAGHDPWWQHGINPNNVTISIEHVKPSKNNRDLLTAAQTQASFRLIHHICQRHHIPRCSANKDGGITSHASIDPVHRSFCPGPYPWTELFSYLAHAS